MLKRLVAGFTKVLPSGTPMSYCSNSAAINSSGLEIFPLGLEPMIPTHDAQVSHDSSGT